MPLLFVVPNSLLVLVQPKQAFSPFSGDNSNFISVTLSQQSFQTLFGGKIFADTVGEIVFNIENPCIA